MLGKGRPYTKAAVNKWEAGTVRMPPGDVIAALSRMFGMPHELLLWGPDQKPPGERRSPTPTIRKPPLSRE